MPTSPHRREQGVEAKGSLSLIVTHLFDQGAADVYTVTHKQLNMAAVLRDPNQGSSPTSKRANAHDPD